MLDRSTPLRRVPLAIFAAMLLMGVMAEPAHAAKKSRKRAAAVAAAAAGGGAALAATQHQKARKPNPTSAESALAQESLAEARLLEVYRLIGLGQMRAALVQAEALTRLHPNFQLAQLVYADLLTLYSPAQRAVADAPAGASSAAARMAELREEAEMRLKALRERPPAGTIPSQFTQLSAKNRHAIAVDASRSRLYLFENSATGLRLLSDYYVSVGRSGIGKLVEGDLRTPLGVYYITSALDPKTLRDFYGAGALPINYPNPYDQRAGKTGSGIWLHGSPPNQFARTPRSTDGCVVLSNVDLRKLLQTVEPRTTPVVIAQSLQWVAPQSALQQSKSFTQALESWREAKGRADLAGVLRHYAADFTSYGKKLSDWTPQLKAELARTEGRGVDLKDLSILRWSDNAETMVVTFGEVPVGRSQGPVKRQYWIRQGGQWKIFFEGVIN